MTMKMKKSKFNSLLVKVICIVLSLSIGLVGAAHIFAASQKPMNYVCDVKVYDCDSDDNASANAKKWFESNGYVFTGINLNQGTKTDRDCYLGYKTTTNRDLALTDIRILPMDTGYQTYDYKSMTDYMLKENYGTAYTLDAAASEFIVNYEAGSPKAVNAYQGLNLFYVEENGKKIKLGDYILAGKADVKFFAKIVLKASTGTINAIIGFLNIGIAAYNNEYDDDAEEDVTKNWAELLPHSVIWEQIDAGLSNDDINDLHKQYNDDAKKLFAQLQDFTTCYENALARYKKNKDKTLDDEGMENLENAVEHVDDVEKDDADLGYITAFDTLNSYDFNDHMKLGDWLIQMGKQSSDTVDLIQFYPVLESMSEAQVSIASVGGFLSAASNLSKNENIEKFEKTLPEIKESIKEYNNSDCIELWDNADDDLDNARIAYTSDAIRKQSAMNTLTKVDKAEVFKEKFDKVMEWINIGLGIAFVATFVIKLVVVVVAKIAVACAAATVSAFCATALAWIAAFSAICFWAGLFVLAFSIGFAIGWWIGSLIKGKVKDLYHTEKPDFIFDAAETPDGIVTIRYKSILNNSGNKSDINRSKQYRWCMLAASTDTRVGSPICEEEAGKAFMCVTGDSTNKLGYSSIKYFGEGVVADCNGYCEKNNVNGCYVHYRTEKSIKEEDEYNKQAESTTKPDGSQDVDKKEEDTKTSEKSYIGDMIVVTGSSIDKAKALVAKKKGAFNIIDYNLSPDQGQYTYIAYTLTNEAKNAITDIRVAPCVGQTNKIQFGDVEYTYANYLGYAMTSDDEKTAPPCDALYFTRDPKAGTPISPDGIHFVRKHADAKPGWEPVTLFCGMPYDFDTCYKPLRNEEQQILSGRHMNESNGWSKQKGVFMYYEPEVKYTSGEKYLSGVFFLGGFNTEKTWQMYWAQTTANVSELISFMREDPETTVYTDVDLAKPINGIEMTTGNYHPQMYLCYVYSYNPKRAIYDISAYQGDTYSDSMSYSMSKATSSGGSINYVSCTPIVQQAYDMAIDQNSSRYVHPHNAYIDSTGLILGGWSDVHEDLADGYITKLPERFKFGYRKSDYIPTALYVSGVTEGKNPLKLSDVVLSKNKHDGVTVENKMVSDVENEKTLAGTTAVGDFHSIYELKTPYSDQPFNLTYPTWFDDDDDPHNPESNLYIYLRDAKPAKGKYISGISVGSYSRTQHKESFPNTSDDDIKGVDVVAEGQAMLAATSGCADELITTNLSINQSDAWYNRQKDGKANKEPPSDKASAYIGVTRTNDPEKAIKGIILYQNDDKTAANQISIDGVKYLCNNTQMPIFMNGKRYYLYTTTNSGVIPGVPIEDIEIDSDPIKSGYATALCGDSNHDAPYGDPKHNNYIHMKYEHTKGEFYNKFFIGVGSNKKAALCDLLSQECVEFVDIDLNKDISGSSVYLGYRTDRINWDKVNSSATDKKRQSALEAELQEAIYDVVVTVDEPYHPEGIVTNDNIYYKPVSENNLNNCASYEERSYGSELYMYFASQFWSKSYNNDRRANTVLPMSAFTAPYSSIAFAPYDRVPYNTSLETSSSTSTTNSPIKWEYVMRSDYSAPANLNAGMASVNGDGHAKDTRVTMFAQRSDGSIKPSGEITGGFVSDTMDVGKVYINQ